LIRASPSGRSARSKETCKESAQIHRLTHDLHCAHCIELFGYLLLGIWGAWGSARYGARLTHMALGPVGLGPRRKSIPLGEIWIPADVELGLARGSARRARNKYKESILGWNIMDDIYHGIVISLSLPKSIIKSYKIIGSKRVIGNVLKLIKIKVKSSCIESVICEMQLKMKTNIMGWPKQFYIHLYNMDGIICIYKDKVFKMKKNIESWKEAIEYGLSLGIPKVQLDFKPNRFEDETF